MSQTPMDIVMMQKGKKMRLIDADAFFNDSSEMRDYEYALQEYEVDAEPVRLDPYKGMKTLQNLYTITTAKKRDSLEWEDELVPWIEIKRWCLIYLATQLPFLVLLVLFN